MPRDAPMRDHQLMQDNSRSPVVSELESLSQSVYQRLTRRRDELLGRARKVSTDLAREGEPLSPDAPDQAVQRSNDEVLVSIGEAAAKELRQLDAALERLAVHRYGLCESCGAPIETRRLAAVPYATRCIRCVET